MIECAGKKFILNGELQPSELFDKSLVYEGDSIYEVIRLVKGCPIFLNDHMERLVTSVKLQKKRLLADVSLLREAIIVLAKIEKKRDSNLKIVFNYKHSGNSFLIYFIESVYPTQIQYQKGVKGILFFAERKDPEAKVINHKLRSSICNKLIAESAYEAILINEDNLITEGSRTNIFFLKNDSLVTAPDNMVLNGITRKNIIEICADNKIKVKLECVKASNLKDYDAVFMTGTSPIVLQFSSIGNDLFNVKFPLIESLRAFYQTKVDESIRQFRSLM
ncbi:MAG TPA: aminotransferase class IV [Bacteroidales bacterium]|nr:aminotransferase class IV [Bacteroidales bacterium]